MMLTIGSLHAEGPMRHADVCDDCTSDAFSLIRVSRTGDDQSRLLCIGCAMESAYLHGANDEGRMLDMLRAGDVDALMGA